MATLRQTPSQTAGPYLHIGLMPALAGSGGDGVARPDAGAGGRVTIRGRVSDGSGTPVADAVIEVWQADGDGVFRNGWGRAACGDDGGFLIETVKPGSIDGSAPHLTLWIVARGINTGLHTRVYFDDEQDANEHDPVLRAVPAERRGTLVARRSAGGDERTYVFDIRLQGADETVFFDI